MNVPFSTVEYFFKTSRRKKNEWQAVTGQWTTVLLFLLFFFLFFFISYYIFFFLPSSTFFFFFFTLGLLAVERPIQKAGHVFPALDDRHSRIVLGDFGFWHQRINVAAAVAKPNGGGGGGGGKKKEEREKEKGGGGGGGGGIRRERGEGPGTRVGMAIEIVAHQPGPTALGSAHFLEARPSLCRR